MRPFASVVVGLLCMFASKVYTQTLGEMLHVVDYRTLKTCHSRTDCLGWQVCASCIHSHLSIAAKYCSDFSYRGICHYSDENFFCSCDEGSLDKPQAQRESWQKLMDEATGQGSCIFDKDCDSSLPGKNARCSTCMDQGGVVNNVCADPENTAALCNPSGSFSTLCSCGQLYPEPERIWPLEERDRFINENKILGGQKESDAGNYLSQPVAAAPEIDFTGFKDEIASSAQAEMMPSDGDWTV